MGEELGWRGYLLPRLRTQVGPTASFWVMGILWSLWHLQAFYTPDFLSLNIMLGLGGAAMTSSLFWGVLAGLFGVVAAGITVGSVPQRSDRTASSRHSKGVPL